jgi:O-antigen/teichoic acid export membrane protein
MSIYGSEFVGSGSLLLVLAFGQVINVLTGPVQSVLVMTGNEAAHRRASYIGGAAYLVSCITLIPAYGGMGAAVATMCGVVVTNLVSALMVWQLRNTTRIWSHAE